MEDTDFDRALIAAAFELAAERGWDRVTVVAAARHGGLDLAQARARFPGRGMILIRFGRLADMAALAESSVASDAVESTRDQLFGMVMRRIDVLQAHRAGMLALLRWLPSKPLAGLFLARATRRSMAWLLQAAGLSTGGVVGALRTKGMVAVWLYTLRAWQKDESVDLSATMAALDTALRQAERAEGMLPCGRGRSSPPADEPPAPPLSDAPPPPPPPPPPPVPPEPLPVVPDLPVVSSPPVVEPTVAPTIPAP